LECHFETIGLLVSLLVDWSSDLWHTDSTVSGANARRRWTQHESPWSE